MKIQATFHPLWVYGKEVDVTQSEEYASPYDDQIVEIELSTQYLHTLVLDLAFLELRFTWFTVKINSEQP